MSKPESTSTIQTAQLSTHSKDARKIDRTDAQIVQNALLIWLDSNIDENNNDYRNNMSHLRNVINVVNTFTDSEECIHFLGDMADEKAGIIISNSLGQQIAPLLYNMPQVDSIFIFCNDKQTCIEEWVQNWSKIKGVFTEIRFICEVLEQTVRQCEQNAIPISTIGSTDDGSAQKNEDRLDFSFMYTQIMKEIFLTIDFEQKHINEFIQHCRELFAGNKKQLKYVDKLAAKYRQHSSIWW